MDLAIAIRTVIAAGDRAYVQAGAGIVADSVPASEYEETLNKARALLRATQLLDPATVDSGKMTEKTRKA
jgi:anthranilate synthase component 1